MPYIGAKELKASDIRRFDVTSSTSATHTLTWTPPTEQSLIVTINGIKQHEDAYSVSGTTLTLSSPLVATDKLEVIGINDIGTTITPAQNSVDTDKIVDDAVTAAKLNTTGTPSSSTFLRGDMAWATPTDQGKVLQVVQTHKSDTSSTTSTSFTDVSGFSASITPASTSNKILVLATIGGQGTSTATQIYFRLDRNGSVIGVGDAAGNRAQISGASIYIPDNNVMGTTAFNYLDSPATTSLLTYKIQFKVDAGTGYINRSPDDTDVFQRGRGTSSITLMEIEG